MSYSEDKFFSNFERIELADEEAEVYEHVVGMCYKNYFETSEVVRRVSLCGELEETLDESSIK